MGALRWLREIKITLPAEWLDRLFSSVNKGTVRLRPGEKVLVKGEWFSVLLVSHEGVMLRPLNGVKVIEK